jgi:hypothetical protein
MGSSKSKPSSDIASMGHKHDANAESAFAFTSEEAALQRAAADAMSRENEAQSKREAEEAELARLRLRLENPLPSDGVEDQIRIGNEISVSEARCRLAKRVWQDCIAAREAAENAAWHAVFEGCRANVSADIEALRAAKGAEYDEPLTTAARFIAKVKKNCAAVAELNRAAALAGKPAISNFEQLVRWASAEKPPEPANGVDHRGNPVLVRGTGRPAFYPRPLWEGFQADPICRDDLPFLQRISTTGFSEVPEVIRTAVAAVRRALNPKGETPMPTKQPQAAQPAEAAPHGSFRQPVFHTVPRSQPEPVPAEGFRPRGRFVPIDGTVAADAADNTAPATENADAADRMAADYVDRHNLPPCD